jgi:F-type H+-transporting ATPase subunit b
VSNRFSLGEIGRKILESGGVQELEMLKALKRVGLALAALLWLIPTGPIGRLCASPQVTGRMAVTNAGTPLLAQMPPALLAALPAQESGSEQKASEKGGHEEIYKTINFVLLAVVLGWILRKPMAGFFAGRADSIEEGLENGRRAIAQAEARLEEIGRKLEHLHAEITSFRDQGAREIEAERERLRQVAEAESEKILAAARIQIQVAMRAAKIELKKFTAQRAVDLAEEMVRQQIDDAARQRLIDEFVHKIASEQKLKV